MQSSLGAKLPGITPNAKCKLRLLKLERIKDWLLMEEEFVSNQERLKPQEERNEEDRTKASPSYHCTGCVTLIRILSAIITAYAPFYNVSKLLHTCRLMSFGDLQ